MKNNHMETVDNQKKTKVQEMEREKMELLHGMQTRWKLD